MKHQNPFRRKQLTDSERADLVYIQSKHADWSALVRRGDIMALARHASVSKTVIIRAVRNNFGSLRTMRLVADWLYTRQIHEARETKENLITD